MKKACFCLLILLVAQFLVPSKSDAIPAFARKHGFNCNMCHVAYPKLNDFGQRFRDNGYQIPGQQGEEKNVFATSFPLAMRTSTGLTVDDVEDLSTVGFNAAGLDVFAAGVLHKNISFLLIYTPRIDEPSADYTGSGDGTNPAQPGGLESVALVLSNIIPEALNVRIGRFEPAYHAFSSKRSYYLVQPYDIYGVETPDSSYIFDDNQVGVELTGTLKHGFKYGAGVVNGTGGTPDNNKAKDLYLNLFKTFGPGDGQSAGQRVGAFGYYGWQPLTIPDGASSPNGEADGRDNKPFYRVGVNGSLNWKTLNLEVLYMRGVDDKALNSISPGKNYEYDGGLAELDYAGLMNNRLVASVAYNWVNPPSYNEDIQVNAYSGLLRWYLGDWTAVNVAMHAEYTHRDMGGDCGCSEDIVSLLVDFAF
jgi:hypothetical protein